MGHIILYLTYYQNFKN
uniref:Uncharacterized protein n=1 Tax=Rhizophora mucronata TaxID=61149 RepID=A0A2P2R3V8_RHIMU